jgi:hypothetical protein
MNHKHSGRGITYNSDAVIVNVCNFVELFFQFSMLSLWPMQRMSVSNHMLQDNLGKPRNIGGCTAAIEDVLYTTGVEVGSVHAARIHLCCRSVLVDRGRGHHERYIWQWFAVDPCQPGLQCVPGSPVRPYDGARSVV